MTRLNDATKPADIAIIGAGIGGAAAALALQQVGLSLDVYEQAAELREVGGAIIIRDPSMALFRQWGILDELRPKMVPVREIEIRDSAGHVQGFMPIEFDEGEGEVAYSVHRADVHGALLSRIPADRLHLGHRLAAVDHLDGYAKATFENGHSVRARLIVGADGLRSTVRARLDTTPMTFMKMVTHRTIAPASLLPKGMTNDRVRMWRADRLAVITFPIRAGEEVAISAPVPTQAPPEHLWGSITADELLSVSAGLDPLIARLIEGRLVDVTTHPVYDKEPIKRWSDGRVVLLGDAAHPMAPMQGQGANQAIQDAGALAAALTGIYRDDMMAALSAYQSVRAPVTDRLQVMSRKPPEMRLTKPRKAG